MNANMEPIVFVVDDDAAARGAIAAWLEREGLRVEQCDAEQFVASCSPTLRGCVILDSSAGVRSGLDVHEHLVARGCELPIIAIAVEGASLALRTARWSLAVDFMEKPLDPQQLLAAVRHALRHAGAVKQANVPLTAPKPPRRAPYRAPGGKEAGLGNHVHRPWQGTADRRARARLPDPRIGQNATRARALSDAGLDRGWRRSTAKFKGGKGEG